jgi:maleylacetate reductase
MTASANHFIHDWPSSRVVFGTGQLRSIGDEVTRLGSRVLLIASPSAKSAADTITEIAGAEVVAARIDETVMHVPTSAAQAAAGLATEVNADLVVCVGGGSAIGLAKGVSKATGLPIIAIPTTYSGSEMTSIWGLTDNNRKVTGRSPAVRPLTVIYDPALTSGLPREISIASGLNAIAHGAEALYAPNTSPLSIVSASEAIACFATALPRIDADERDVAARELAMRGAWLAGWALNVSSMGLHHKLCHVIGGALNLPHSPLHAAMLPYSIAYTAPAAPEAMRRLVEGLGAASSRFEDAGGVVWDVATALGAPTSLSVLGMGEADIQPVADAVMREIDSGGLVNPRPINRVGVADLLAGAWRGERPV